MKEARIIMPVFDNDGGSLDVVHRWLKNQLANTFGGYTTLPALGGWSNEGNAQEERVIAYDVAMPDVPANHRLVERIATELLDRGKQQAIYVRFPGGEVKLIERTKSLQPAVSKDEQNWLEDMIERHSTKEVA
jgi:hypothetical protein